MGVFGIFILRFWVLGRYGVRILEKVRVIFLVIGILGENFFSFREDSGFKFVLFFFCWWKINGIIALESDLVGFL